MWRQLRLESHFGHFGFLRSNTARRSLGQFQRGHSALLTELGENATGANEGKVDAFGNREETEAQKETHQAANIGCRKNRINTTDSSSSSTLLTQKVGYANELGLLVGTKRLLLVVEIQYGNAAFHIGLTEIAHVRIGYTEILVGDFRGIGYGIEGEIETAGQAIVQA